MAPRGELLGAEAGARAAAQTPDDEAAEREEQALLRDMMDDTEREIASEAFGEDPPENDGDTTLEDEAGDDDLEDPGPDDLEDPELEDEIDETANDDLGREEPDRGDPRVALRAERARRQELERQLAEAQGFREGVNAVPRQTQQQERPARPDMFSDPEGWEKAVKADAAQEAAQQVHQDRVNAALAEAHEQWGDEFQVAFNAFTSQPRNAQSAQLARRMVNSPDPGAFLMRWAEPVLEDFRTQREEQRLESIGALLEDDPALRDAVLSRLSGRQPRERGAPRGDRQPQTQRGGRRTPPSLNSAGGSGSSRVGADPRGFDASEQSIFDYAFSDR